VVARSAAASPEYDRNGSDYSILATLLTVAGVTALYYFQSRGEILLSGDAVAHINIARRVFDSRTPGPLQLGSVWLPLPHLLTIPFVVSKRMWQSGLGGSVVSVISYVLAGIGMFRLLRPYSRLAAWVGTAIFAANPNLLYVQTTALNEPLYIACFVWAVLYFAEARRALHRGEVAGAWLEKGAMALAAGTLTRYDGWFLACLCWAAILPATLTSLKSLSRENAAKSRRVILKALLLTALAPTLWLAYNLGAKGNALEFANGPYSAKAIAQRTSTPGAPPYPGEGHPWTAGIYFTKAAQLNIGEGVAAKLILFLAIASVVFAIRRDGQTVLLLWSPVLFYALSIAYGSVPIFLPVWWPFSYYNVRYGLELLPAIAAGGGFTVFFIEQLSRAPKVKLASAGLLAALAMLSYVGAWRSIPICLREVRVNGRARRDADRQLATVLSSLPKQSTVLAYTGAHSGAFEMAGVPLCRTINEGIFMVWDGALQHPAAAADYVIAADDDPVGASVTAHPEGLKNVAEVEVEGQARIVVYKSSQH